MTLQSSGPISIDDLKNEWQTSANDLFSYYRGGGIVQDQAPNLGIPTSGAISLEDFYGASNVNPADVTPSNSWFNNVSGASPQTTNTVTIAGIDTSIDLYYTVSGATPVLQYSLNGGAYTGWTDGGPGSNTITVNNGDTLTLRFSAFSTSNGDISIYNDSDGDAFLAGVSWSLTAGKQ
jgi:hypothetical protein